MENEKELYDTLSQRDFKSTNGIKEWEKDFWTIRFEGKRIELFNTVPDGKIGKYRVGNVRDIDLNELLDYIDRDIEIVKNN